MTKFYGKQDITETFKATSGIGTLTVNVPFVPDYVKVDFHGAFLSSKPKEALIGDDEVYWNLTAVTPTTYRLDIGWSIYSESRLIYYRASRLAVDPV